MEGGVTLFRGAGVAACRFLEPDRSTADGYYLGVPAQAIYVGWPGGTSVRGPDPAASVLASVRDNREVGALEPQDLSFVDNAPFHAEATIVCPTPATAVFAVLADHRRWPEWIGGGVTAVVPTSDPEGGLGATRIVRLLGLARIEETFIGWSEPTLWAFTATRFRPRIFSKLVERFVLEPAGDQRCHVTYRMAADFPPLLRPVGGIVVSSFGSVARTALGRLIGQALERRGEI